MECCITISYCLPISSHHSDKLDELTLHKMSTLHLLFMCHKKLNVLLYCGDQKPNQCVLMCWVVTFFLLKLLCLGCKLNAVTSFSALFRGNFSIVGEVRYILRSLSAQYEKDLAITCWELSAVTVETFRSILQVLDRFNVQGAWLNQLSTFFFQWFCGQDLIWLAPVTTSNCARICFSQTSHLITRRLQASDQRQLIHIYLPESVATVSLFLISLTTAFLFIDLGEQTKKWFFTNTF